MNQRSGRWCEIYLCAVWFFVEHVKEQCSHIFPAACFFDVNSFIIFFTQKWSRVVNTIRNEIIQARAHVGTSVSQNSIVREVSLKQWFLRYPKCLKISEKKKMQHDQWSHLSCCYWLVSLSFLHCCYSLTPVCSCRFTARTFDFCNNIILWLSDNSIFETSSIFVALLLRASLRTGLLLKLFVLKSQSSMKSRPTEIGIRSAVLLRTHPIKS